MKEKCPSVFPSDKSNESQPVSTSFLSSPLPAISSFAAFLVLVVHHREQRPRSSFPVSQRTQLQGDMYLLLTKAIQWVIPENVCYFTESRDLNLILLAFGARELVLCGAGLPCALHGVQWHPRPLPSRCWSQSFPTQVVATNSVSGHGHKSKCPLGGAGRSSQLRTTDLTYLEKASWRKHPGVLTQCPPLPVEFASVNCGLIPTNKVQRSVTDSFHFHKYIYFLIHQLVKIAETHRH